MFTRMYFLKKFRCCPILFAFHVFLFFFGFPQPIEADSLQPTLFDFQDTGAPDPNLPAISPWKIVPLDPDFGGMWIVAGDVNQDGEVDIISAENFNRDDVHDTSAVVAHKLDGQVLWQWGDPNRGRKEWFHDVACQIYDWDGDGKNEVVLATREFLVELDGTTGKERRQIPIPEDATDCIVFCNLSGRTHPSDILVKNRYRQIWAYNEEGKLLWTIRDPAGYRTAHQPYPIDLDGDGKDEIMAGYAMLNADGSIRWVYKSEKVNLNQGHLDCCRVFARGSEPGQFRLVLSCCGANNLAMLDGNGNVIWEQSGFHFESIKVGRMDPRCKEPGILVDIDHQPQGKSPLWRMDGEGNLVGRIVTDYSRHHALIDWTGDGVQEILSAYNRGMYDHEGKRIATFEMPNPPSDPISTEQSILIGDMTGDGIPDVLINTPQAIYIFKNEQGSRPLSPIPLGTGVNVTLY